MTWSVSMIGVPEKIVAKLEEQSGTLTGQSKEEFDEAKPHLQALVAANVFTMGNLVKLDASGHGSIGADGKKTYGSCQVSLQQFYGTLVL